MKNVKKLTPAQRDWLVDELINKTAGLGRDFSVAKSEIKEILSSCTDEKEPSIQDMVMSYIDGSITFDEMLAREREDNLKPFVPDDAFERVMEAEFGERIRNDDDFAIHMYAALSNNDWKSGEDTYSASMRSNGGFIARVRGKGETYLTWYCSNYSRGIGDGEVIREIKEGFAKHGWAHEAM